MPVTGAAPVRPQGVAAQIVRVHRGTATLSVVIRRHEALLLRLLPPAALP
jgi:hypothetical protein